MPAARSCPGAAARAARAWPSDPDRGRYLGDGVEGIRVVLPSEHRLTSRDAFRRVVRSGRRAASRTVVVYFLRAEPGDQHATALAAPPTVGFVVSRAVGNAVTRNAVKRRLRHLTRERLGQVPAGGGLVVRALPAAGTATYAALAADLDRCLVRVTT